MGLELAVLALCFAYFLSWVISDFRIQDADYNLNLWIAAHPGIWPGEYENGRELVQHCMRACMARRFFPTRVNLDEKLMELRSLLGPREKVQHGFVLLIKIE
ncbi:MAG: hypothetical protein UW74_C0034G0004 [Candidatus Giovannonibacteria bacterium GW2011_GWC2_44_8]|uniref:Uncharacterized protein n=4 Tax=Candidatus Giovannoniibacteriota TaxID=1752738 RepID=A0A1F5XBS5_9BACT|nr:MAG: hypothetical protein UW74_C0034G0004 [Candidatus Giovannonibacteria bacterium GW2011_GWC2_44_8]OGF74341.1 MAG: hypothetical protein A2W57_03265 [Candidatus Giovannonibacteria bacterium RIFCSPHIGHO2_02_43_16]OGF85405.1 MAG: hypothetical protein A2Z63_02105 [Candidatus Giovannonibacteria bacterium RIFCSPLOWO2_02_44_8]OGF94682.1 MAG: hypothetical protein A2Y47_00710 [Candidatus Giovannonibacteria bacterium RIFCSPLOWO2_12_43_8]